MLQLRPIANAGPNIRTRPIRRLSSATPRSPPASPPFPIVPVCPSPTCACAETPAGLQIDRKRDLNGSMAPHAQHVVISTGKSDWTSRIEDDGQGTLWGDLGRQLKAMLGRGGKYSDPYNNIMITNSSFLDPENGQRVLLFPSSRSILLPDTSSSTVEHFIQQFLLPEALHPMHDALSTSHKKRLTRAPGALKALPESGDTALQKPIILICSHNARDARCGVMGPLLQSEFVRQLDGLGFQVSISAVHPHNEHHGGKRPAAQVGQISHIGGHKWAGNVIISMPRVQEKDGKTSEESKAKPSPLAGCGIWYGRVEPKHVEGIIKETILGGTVIKELFRGGTGPKAEVLRLPI